MYLNELATRYILVTGICYPRDWIFSKRCWMVCFITGCPPLVRFASKACCFLRFLARSSFSLFCFSRSRCLSSASCLRWSAVACEKAIAVTEKTQFFPSGYPCKLQTALINSRIHGWADRSLRTSWGALCIGDSSTPMTSQYS